MVTNLRPFVLNEVLSSFYAQSRIADPGEFADALLATIPREHIREALRQSLRDTVRIYFSRQRMNIQDAVEQSEPEQGARKEPGKGKVNARFAGVHAAYDALLRQREFLGDRWVFFGACTVADLDFLIGSRRDNAARSLAKAEFYERFKDALVKHKAAKVAALPKAVLTALAGGK